MGRFSCKTLIIASHATAQLPYTWINLCRLSVDEQVDLSPPRVEPIAYIASSFNHQPSTRGSHAAGIGPAFGTFRWKWVVAKVESAFGTVCMFKKSCRNPHRLHLTNDARGMSRLAPPVLRICRWYQSLEDRNANIDTF